MSQTLESSILSLPGMFLEASGACVLQRLDAGLQARQAALDGPEVHRDFNVLLLALAVHARGDRDVVSCHQRVALEGRAVDQMLVAETRRDLLDGHREVHDAVGLRDGHVRPCPEAPGEPGAEAIVEQRHALARAFWKLASIVTTPSTPRRVLPTPR